MAPIGTGIDHRPERTSSTSGKVLSAQCCFWATPVTSIVGSVLIVGASVSPAVRFCFGYCQSAIRSLCRVDRSRGEVESKLTAAVRVSPL